MIPSLIEIERSERFDRLSSVLHRSVTSPFGLLFLCTASRKLLLERQELVERYYGANSRDLI
jgi:hypothetical protein